VSEICVPQAKIAQSYRSAANRRCIKAQIIPRVGADDAMELEPSSLCW
jgi:hypothetical protein